MLINSYTNLANIFEQTKVQVFFWLMQNQGLVHLEKTADKWGKNGNGDEWQEKWWEHYDASGKAEKWAHKWCSIDPNTQLDAGHAHVWHERYQSSFLLKFLIGYNNNPALASFVHYLFLTLDRLHESALYIR